MKLKIGTVEYIYVAVCIVLLWNFVDLSKVMAVGLGYLLCLIFLPAYKYLIWAGEFLPVRRFIYESLFGMGCIFLIQLLSAEDKSSEMVALFLASYIACKPLRLSLALAIGKAEKLHRKES